MAFKETSSEWSNYRRIRKSPDLKEQIDYWKDQCIEIFDNECQRVIIDAMNKEADKTLFDEIRTHYQDCAGSLENYGANADVYWYSENEDVLIFIEQVIRDNGDMFEIYVAVKDFLSMDSPDVGYGYENYFKQIEDIKGVSVKEIYDRLKYASDTMEVWGN